MNILRILKIFGTTTSRHCESRTRAEAIHPILDCHVALLLAMTGDQNKIEDAKIKPRTDTPSEQSEVGSCEHGFDLRRNFQSNFRAPNRTLFASILAFTFFLFPNYAQAQTMRISPAILKIELSPGSVTEHIFTVENLLNTPLPLKTTSEGFDASDEESGFKITENSISPLASWININTPDTIISASSSAQITAKITVPDHVPLGGYYAVIFFTPLTTTQNLDQNSNQITAKVGAITLANVGVTSDQNKAEITDFSFDQNFYNNQSPQVILRTKNTGLNYFTAKPQITIDPLIGKTTTIDWEEKTLLPGKTRRWDKQLELPNNYGIFYKISLAVSLENGQLVTQTKNIFAFPVSTAIKYTIGIFILLYSLRHTKRIKRAINILIKKA